MKRIFIILALAILLVSPLVLGDTAFFVQQNQPYDLKFSCENSGGACSGSANCNISIFSNQNSSSIINNSVTTNLFNGFFELQLDGNNTAGNGEYTSRVSCVDGALNDTVTFTYEVNPTGIRPSDQKSSAINLSIGFMIVLGLIFLISFIFVKMKMPIKLSFLIISLVFFLISLNLILVNIQDAVVSPSLAGFFEGITVVSWIVYRGAAIAFITLWIITFIVTILQKKHESKIRRLEG